MNESDMKEMKESSIKSESSILALFKPESNLKFAIHIKVRDQDFPFDSLGSN